MSADSFTKSKNVRGCKAKRKVQQARKARRIAQKKARSQS